MKKNLQKARPYEENGYRQLLKFVDSQSPFAALLQKFKQKIGYPPVGFLAKPALRCELAAAMDSKSERSERPICT